MNMSSPRRPRPRHFRAASARTSALLALALLLPGCSLIENLTEPGTPTDRTISLRSTPENLPDGGGEVTLEATVTAGGAPELGVEVTFRTSTGELIPGDRATTDADGIARVRLRTTTTAEVSASVEAGGVQVSTASAHTVAVGDDVVASGAIEFEVTFSSKPANLNETVEITVKASNPSGEGARGDLLIEFGDGRQRSAPDFRKKAVFEHTYREVSIFNVVVSLTEEDGTVSRATQDLKVVDASVVQIALSSADGDDVVARDPVRFTIVLSREDGRAAVGDIDIDWGDSRSTRLRDARNTERVEHTFRDPGSYRVRATVTAPNGRTNRDDLRIRVDERITIQVQVATAAGEPGEETAISITVNRSDGKGSKGIATVDFGDGATDTVTVSGGSGTASHVYDDEGTYTVTVAYVDEKGRTANGTGEVEISEDAIVPGVATDEINPDSIVWHRNADTKNWTIASNLYSASATSGRQVLAHTKAGQWPAADLFDGDHAGPNQPLEGNAWVVVNFGGTWHAAPFEWLISGETVKTVPADQFPDHIKLSQFDNWIPQKGETVGLFASSRAWVGVTDVKERTQIRLVVWE